MLDAMHVHSKEKSLKPLVFVWSGLVWLFVACTLVGLLYGLLALPFLLMGQAFFLGHLRGGGVRVDADQLPELHARVVRASQKLGLERVPEVYVLQAGGALNAFATKLFSRSYVVLFSDVLDACSTDEEVEFVVSHELAHHAAGHLKWRLFTLPAMLVPLLGPAYSRACEYTCDRAALFAVGALEPSQRALGVLAAGGKAAQRLNLPMFAQQQANAGEFWPAVAELSSSHPFLSKRVAMLATWHGEQLGTPVAGLKAPERPFFSYVLALFFGRQAFTLLMVAYVAGILATIAVPNFLKFQERARQAQQHSRSVAPPAGFDNEQGPADE